MGHGVLYDFINKLKKNPKELVIVGDGQQERPYFLVDDCIDGMLCALDYPPNTYNLASEDCTIVDDIAHIVIEEMGLKEVNIIHTPTPAYDPSVVRLNVDKIKNIGWKAKYTSAEAARIATRRLLLKDC
jgi:UDP-glucose 4-epimerase